MFRMFKHQKFFVDGDVHDREALCKKLTDNGATIVANVGENDSVHIFSAFEGAKYEECLKKGYRVIGSPCLQETLRSGKSLPRTTQPIYSRIMEGIVVSGDVVEEKAKLKNYIYQMNGTWTDELNGNTQYFITTEPGSVHYLWALEFGSNIVQPSWITESWVNCCLSDPKYHLLPPFSGCIISVTGLSTATRATIQQLTTHYGGKYSQQLSRKVTHLLCDKPKGRKYTTAITWGVHVVTTNWFFDSINMKGAADVSRYELPSLPTDIDGAPGTSVMGLGSTPGDALYLRSPYSRSNNPYAMLASSARPRPPILLRRQRTQGGSNHTPLFALPSTTPQHNISSTSHHPVFAQTTQIQSGSQNNGTVPLAVMRQLALQSQNKSLLRAPSRESRANIDKYKDVAEQLRGLLRKCDQVIDMCAPSYTSTFNTSFDNLLLTSSITNNIDTLNNLYQELNTMCNHITVTHPLNMESNNSTSASSHNGKKSNNKPTTSSTSLPTTDTQPTSTTITTATTTTTTTTTETTETTSATTTTALSTKPPTSVTEDSTDLDMESDEDSTVTPNSSEQEK